MQQPLINPLQDIAERGLNYGDGFFTTALIKNGHIVAQQSHQQRLIDAAQRLGFPDLDLKAVFEYANQLSNKRTLGVAKIVITRGSGGRGYTPNSQADCHAYISTHNYPEHYKEWQLGIDIGVAENRLGFSPIGGIKHLNRLEQVMIKKELEKKALCEAVTLDIEQQVVGVSAGNLFWCRDDTWFTPELSLSGIEGITRNSILQQMRTLDIKCKVGRYQLDHLQQSHAAFACNCLMGVVPIKHVQRHKLDIEPVLKLKQNLKELTFA